MGKDPADTAREKIERMQLLNEGKILTLAPSKPMAEQNYAKLKAKYERLKKIIINSLIALDILFKFGSPVALYFWAMPQNGLMQGISLATYVIVLTIISKTITRVKTHDLED